MASDTDTGLQPSCSAFIKHSARRLRRRTSASKTRLPEATGPDDDDYGFLGGRLASGKPSSPSAAHPRAPQRRRRDVPHAGVSVRGADHDHGRRASIDGGGSVASSGSIPITLGSLAASGDAGASSQRCSIDEIERRPPSPCCSRPDSPWSEMSIHLASERPRPTAAARPPPPPQQQQQQQSRCFGLAAAAAAAETIGKYHCQQGRSRSAGPPTTRLRGGGGTDCRARDMSFYAHVRHAREAAATPAADVARSKSECRSSARSAVPGASSTSSAAAGAGGGAAWERPSRSVSRRQRRGDREQAAPAEEVRRPRSSSKSRDIIALYTRSATPAAAAPSARSQSCPRRANSAASSLASTLVSGGVAAAGGWPQPQTQPQTQPQSTVRERRSKSAAPPRWRVSDTRELATATPAATTSQPAVAFLGQQRSRSQPRLQSGRADSTASAGGGGSRADSVMSSRDDSLTESLRLWAAARSSVSRSSLSMTPRSRRDSGQSARRQSGGGGGDGDGRPVSQSFVAVLEMDKDVNARIEEALNNGNSLRPADVPLMAIAGYRPADDSWASGDEVRVEAGAVVLAKYKQCEWVYVCTPDGGEGFMPYAYTKPIKVDAAAAGAASAAASSPLFGPRPVRRGHASAPAAQAAATAAVSMQMCPTPRPRPSPRLRRIAAGSRQESSPCPSLTASSVDSSRGWPAEAPSPAFRQGAAADEPSHVERIWRRVWNVTTAPGGGYAASSRLTARGDWRSAADASSVASSDGDSVFYEATLVAFDADTLSASGSEEAQRAWSAAAATAAEYSASSRESTPVMAAAAAASHCTDYYGNAAFFSDSGISEPCSEPGDADRRRRFRSAAVAPPAKASALPVGGCAAAAAARTGRSRAAQHPGGDRRGEDRAAGGGGGGGGRRRRGGNGHRLRPSNDALERARAADARSDGRGSAGPAYRSLCPELIRDYSGPAATVVYDYDAENEDDVGARAGDSVCVLNEDDPQWLWVQKRDGSEGFLPRDNVLFLPFKPSTRPDERRLMTTVLAAV